MTSPPEDPSSDDFNMRLDKALQEHIPPSTNTQTSPTSGVGRAMTLGIEFFSAVAIAAGIGIAIDHWFHTSPWGLIILFFLGIGAAFLNIYRFVNNMGYDIGYDSDKTEDSPPQDET